MTAPTRILLQAATTASDNDWTIDRFSILRKFLEAQTEKNGIPVYDVTSRNRLSFGSDPVLSTLDSSEFDELWLFAVDGGEGLPTRDCEGIARFWQCGETWVRYARAWFGEMISLAGVLFSTFVERAAG